MKDLIIGIDIGTTKVLTVVARVSKERTISGIAGYGFSRARGLQKGVVVDFEEARASVEDSVRAAEKMAGIKIKRAYLSISGSHIRSTTTHSMLTVSKYPREINLADKKRLEDLVKNRIEGPDSHVVHRVTYKCQIDDGGIVKSPVGMVGCRIEADVHIVLGKVNSIESIVKCVKNLGITVEGLAIEALAASKAVLTDTEEQMGVALADIGGETTDIAIFKNNELIYSEVIPMGGEHFTRDIATVLGISLSSAESLKRSLQSLEEEGKEKVEVSTSQSSKPKEVNVGYVKSIINSRTEELLEHIYGVIMSSNHSGAIRSGMVLTGGAAQTIGLLEKGKRFFGTPVRIGTPDANLKVLDKINILEAASAIGLLLYSLEGNEDNSYDGELERQDKSSKGSIFGINFGSLVDAIYGKRGGEDK